MRTRVFASAGMVGTVCSLIALPLCATTVAPKRTFTTPTRPTLTPAVDRRHGRSRYLAGGAVACTSNYGTVGEYFVGANDSGAPNYAGGADSGVIAGRGNGACDTDSAIGGGFSNVIGTSADGATDSFIGAGDFNGVSGDISFIGAGYGNGITGGRSFVGAGTYGSATGQSAFVGAGGYGYVEGNTKVSPGTDNIAGATDSFVGAGDLNQISSSGNGSFIGAGGYTFALNGGTSAGNYVTGADSFIGAGDQNYVATNNSFIGGGTANNTLSPGNNSVVTGGDGNATSGPESFIGAGIGNSTASSGSYSVVTGGYGNTASGTGSFIGAGEQNATTSSANYSVVVGGYGNTMSAQKASLGGGEYNKVGGSFATVPGGYRDEALGNESFAAGSQAEARYAGSFVWSDYTTSEKPQSDSAINEFVARASGGVYFFSNATSSAGVHLAAGSGTWSSLSDRNAKTNIVPLDDASILAKVAALPIGTWQYKTEHGVRHAGPMAQDFYAAFGLGEDDRHITTIDEDGIALAAIKALRAEDQRNVAALRAADRRKDSDIASLRTELRRLEITMARRDR